MKLDIEIKMKHSEMIVKRIEKPEWPPIHPAGHSTPMSNIN